MENLAWREINERSFSNIHTRMATTQVTLSCMVVVETICTLTNGLGARISAGIAKSGVDLLYTRNRHKFLSSTTQITTRS